MYKPFGCPQFYIDAFGTNGILEYPEPRFYCEMQTWATHAGETPGHHSEHVHWGCAIPNGQTMTAPFELDVQFSFHNVVDYSVTSASQSAVTQTGSRSLWNMTDPAVLAELQAAIDGSGNTVTRAGFSVTTLPPANNGLKEVRGAIVLTKSGPNAVFLEWRTDPRWYFTDNYSGLPASVPIPSQRALRVRPQMTFLKPDGTSQSDYHHSGWSDPTDPDPASTISKSALWTADDVAEPWDTTQDKAVSLYVTDGGGPATLMIDPDFHNHYAAPTTSCPNVDAAGNCLGAWFWQPSNSRKEIFGGVPHTNVTIPAAVLDALSPGLHKLVFKSDDFPECVRNANFQHWNNCPPTSRGSWTNVSVLPFWIQGTPQTCPTCGGSGVIYV